MKAREFKRIWGHNYDFYYLLKLEQRKIQNMARDFAKWQHYVGWERTVCEMNLCVQLIDIILEEDKYYKSWLHNSFGLHSNSVKKFPIHINSKNYKRFFKNMKELPKDKMYDHWIPELRKRKALSLYNNIRTSRICTWWD